MDTGMERGTPATSTVRATSGGMTVKLTKWSALTLRPSVAVTTPRTRIRTPFTTCSNVPRPGYLQSAQRGGEALSVTRTSVLHADMVGAWPPIPPSPVQAVSVDLRVSLWISLLLLLL